MTCKSRIALLASLAVWSSCILASATAQDNAASAPREQGAPDSNFVDLAKHGSNKLRQAIKEYLQECSLKEGENPNGLWVAYGIAPISGQGGAANWGEERNNAFLQAQLSAQEQLIKSIAIRSQVSTISEFFADQSTRDPQFSDPKGFDERMASKVSQLSEAMIDSEIVKLGGQPEPKEKLESKRTKFRKALTRKSKQQALQSVTGFYVLQTFECVDEDNPGKVSIGVVIGRRPSSLGWISMVAKGGGATGVPREEPGRSLAERIPQDPKVLFERFGVRVVADENGQVCLIAYGQTSPAVVKGMDQDVIDEMVEAGGRMAESEALKAMTEFLDSTLAWQRLEEQGQSKVRSEILSQIDDVEVTREDHTTEIIREISEKSTKWSQAVIKGATPYYAWSGNHPEFGNPLCGCVMVWTPESAAAANRYASGKGPGAEGFRATGGKPGVRRGQGEDVPSGASAAAIPVPSQEPAGCSDTEAVGAGLDLDSAVLQALENAVRQSCGVAIATSQEIAKRTERSLKEVRLSEALDEMRSSYESSSLAKQDIQVRTKGYIKEYRVLAEELEAPGKVRVTVCAKVATFDPSSPRPGARPTLILVPPTTRSSSYAILGSTVSASEMVQCFESEMSREIFKAKLFTVLERQRLAAILGEHALIASGLVDLQEQVKLGKLYGGDIALLTEIEDVFATQEEKIIKLTGARIVKRQGAAKLNWKLVIVGTGEVIDQDSVHLPLDEQGFRDLEANFPATQLTTVMAAVVVRSMVPQLAERAAPLRIAQVVGGSVFLNRGRETLKPGMLLDVYRQGAELKDPTTGVGLGRSDQKVGSIRVERCERDFSVAAVVGGDVGESDIGSVCRKP